MFYYFFSNKLVVWMYNFVLDFVKASKLVFSYGKDRLEKYEKKKRKEKGKKYSQSVCVCLYVFYEFFF